MPAVASLSGDTRSAVDGSSGSSLVPCSPEPAVIPLRHGLRPPISRLAVSWSQGNTLRVSVLRQSSSFDDDDNELGGRVVELRLGGAEEISETQWRRIAYGSVSPFARLQSRRSAVSSLSSIPASSPPPYSFDWDIGSLLSTPKSHSEPVIEDRGTVPKTVEEPNSLKAAWEPWEIIHIRDKAPIPPDQQPTVEVFAASIQPKLANTLIRRLNQIAPLEGLQHVKRVQKNHDGRSTQGNTELLVILCLASSQSNNDSCILPNDVQELITSNRLSVFKTKVCKYAATSKEEWEEQCKLWPTSFHPPTYNIDGIDGFSKEDSESIFYFMNVAIQLAKSCGDGLIVNAAVIVNPSTKEVISKACDQTFSRDSTPDENAAGTSSLKQPETNSPEKELDGSVCKTAVSNGAPDQKEHSFSGVSCLFPWAWAKQQSHSTSASWHPLRHCTIVAIESSAARDRHLFPGLGNTQDESTETDETKCSCIGSPAERQKTNSQVTRPYLCTGYDIYLVWEPCTMCAMALVHQRIKRIFFALPNTNAGALGSVFRLQGERSLNHHFAVFRVVQPEPVLGTETRLPGSD